MCNITIASNTGLYKVRNNVQFAELLTPQQQQGETFVRFHKTAPRSLQFTIVRLERTSSISRIRRKKKTPETSATVRTKSEGNIPIEKTQFRHG